MCTHTHVCTHAPDLRAHANAYTGIRVHARVPETMKDKFFAFKTWFGTNPTSSGCRSKPLFFDYKKPYMVPFQHTKKILRENKRFTRKSESKREFFHKKSSSQYFSD